MKEVWIREVFESHYQFDEQVMFGMLRTDMVHLNTYGNRALIHALMRPLLHMWRGKIKAENIPTLSTPLIAKAIPKKKKRLLDARKACMLGND